MTNLTLFLPNELLCKIVNFSFDLGHKDYNIFSVSKKFKNINEDTIYNICANNKEPFKILFRHKIFLNMDYKKQKSILKDFLTNNYDKLDITREIIISSKEKIIYFLNMLIDLNIDKNIIFLQISKYIDITSENIYIFVNNIYKNINENIKSISMLYALKNNNYNIFVNIIKKKKKFYNNDFSLSDYYKYLDSESKLPNIIYIYIDILNMIIEKDDINIINIIHNNLISNEKDEITNIINYIFNMYIIRKSTFCAPKILKRTYDEHILGHNYANRMLINILSNSNIELILDIISNYNHILELDLNSKINSIFIHKLEVDKKLLECINILLTKIDIIDDSILIHAINKNNIEIIKLLLTKIDIINENILYHSINKNNIEIIKLLLTKIDVLDENILYHTISKNNIEILKLLLEKNIKVKLNDFLLAIKCGNENIIELLVNKGIDLKNYIISENSIIKSIYHNNSNIIKLLLKLGAKINSKNSYEILNFTLQSYTENPNLEIKLEIINILFKNNIILYLPNSKHKKIVNDLILLYNNIKSSNKLNSCFSKIISNEHSKLKKMKHNNKKIIEDVIIGIR